MGKSNIIKIGLFLLILFWVTVIYFFYSYFYATSGRHPDWVYETPRPFFAGWSNASPPLIQNDMIYFCAGYEWDKNVLLTALRKDGTVLWKTEFFSQCKHLNIINDRIYVGQRYVMKLPSPAASEYYGQTFVIDLNNGQVIEKLPFQYSYIADDILYSLDKNNILIHNLNGKIIRKVPVSYPEFIWLPHLKNSPYRGLIRTNDGFLEINSKTNKAEIVSDKGRRIFTIKSSDKYFCYTSYDTKYDIRKQNKNIDERIICRNKITWENVFEDKAEKIGCSTFYINNDYLFTQKIPCTDENGYIATNLTNKNKTLVQSKDIPRLELLYTSAETVIGELLSPRYVIIKDKMSGKTLWDFKSTGWMSGLVETKDAIYLYDDDGKLYMFKK